MYQRILVPIDGSSTSNRGLAEAIQLAKLTGGQLRVAHVVDELSFALAMDAYAGHAGNWLEELRGNALKLLEEARAKAAGEGVAADTVLLDSFKGTVHDQVVAETQASKAELIVIGTHGRRDPLRWDGVFELGIGRNPGRRKEAAPEHRDLKHASGQPGGFDGEQTP